MNETFDDDVLRAIAKWPNVPACYGWLQLDRRGHWLIKGARITHARAVAFLNRNYARDADGAWFVQNGPQRVYCELAYTPWIYRLDGHNGVVTHTDLAAREISGIYVDEHGNVLLTSEHGVGLLDDRDIARFAESLGVPGEPHADPAERLASLATGTGTQAGLRIGNRDVVASVVSSTELGTRFDFIPSPVAPAVPD